MKILSFIFEKKIHIIALCLLLVLSVMFGSQKQSNAYDQYRKELTNEMNKQEQRMQKSIEAQSEKRQQEIKTLSDSLQVIKSAYNKSRDVLSIELQKLKKQQNEIIAISYRDSSDTSLLERLRTNN